LSGKRSVYFLFFALAPLLFALQSPDRSEFIHQISLTVFGPFFQAGRLLTGTVRDTSEGISRFWDLYHSHAQLTEQVALLEQKQVQMTELEKENDRLRKLLDFKKITPYKTLPARVIGWDLAPWRKTAVLEKGSKQGIKKRMSVVNSQGLVGRVIEVAPYSSRMILLPDPESRAGALFQESRDLGVVEGDGSSLLKMTHVDRQSTVKVGDVVVTSGLGGVYPKGIPIGKVETVGTEKESLELYALVRPFVNFSKLEEVLCIASSQADS